MIICFNEADVQKESVKIKKIADQSTFDSMVADAKIIEENFKDSDNCAVILAEEGELLSSISSELSKRPSFGHIRLDMIPSEDPIVVGSHQKTVYIFNDAGEGVIVYTMAK